MEDLRGRNAIVTGASRGLGVHIAKALAREGVNLVLAARSADALDAVREEVQALEVDAVSVPTDLSDPAQVRSLAEEAESEMGPVDILVNNAGLESTVPYQKYPTEDIELTVKVNLIAPMLLTHAVLSGMLARGRGHVVNMSSLAGKTGLPYQAPYGATKAGLVMFTHQLRMELVDEPVGVSVVCPGFVAEDGMYARVEKSGESAPMFLRPTTPERVADAVVKVVRKDLAEVIVNPLPVRPLVALREVAPGIVPFLHKWMGTTAFSRKVSERRMEKDPD